MKIEQMTRIPVMMKRYALENTESSASQCGMEKLK
jgi:hypothetical protein